MELTVDDLDVLLRSKGLEETLAEVDRHVLGPAGLSARDIEVLRDIWRKLSSRRMNRKRRHSNKVGRLLQPGVPNAQASR